LITDLAAASRWRLGKAAERLDAELVRLAGLLEITASGKPDRRKLRRIKRGKLTPLEMFVGLKVMEVESGRPVLVRSDAISSGAVERHRALHEMEGLVKRYPRGAYHKPWNEPPFKEGVSARRKPHGRPFEYFMLEGHLGKDPFALLEEAGFRTKSDRTLLAKKLVTSGTLDRLAGARFRLLASTGRSEAVDIALRRFDGDGTITNSIREWSAFFQYIVETPYYFTLYSQKEARLCGRMLVSGKAVVPPIRVAAFMLDDIGLAAWTSGGRTQGR
jgi:hypothetical protein